MAAQSSWTINPADFMVSVNNSVKQTAIDVATEIFNRVVDVSPVYTGSFRSSWRMAHTAPNLTVTNGGTETSPLAAPRSPVLTGVPKYPKIFVTNAQPYAVRLEYGWSKQAPSGIVRTTLAALR